MWSKPKSNRENLESSCMCGTPPGFFFGVMGGGGGGKGGGASQQTETPTSQRFKEYAGE